MKAVSAVAESQALCVVIADDDHTGALELVRRRQLVGEPRLDDLVTVVAQIRSQGSAEVVVRVNQDQGRGRRWRS